MIGFSIDPKLGPVAIYAAALSTFNFFWEIYRWFWQGPKLELRVIPNMIIVGSGYKDPNSYITFNVANKGTNNTTITNVCFIGYKNVWKKFIKKSEYNAIVNHDNSVYPIPYVLKIGETFTSKCIQNADIEKISQEFLLYGAIFHSFSKKPKLSKILIIK